MAGSEAKNPLPARMDGMNAMDMMGLSWIFTEDMFCKELTEGRM